MKTQELRTHELYLRLVLLSVKHAAWLLVKVAASEGERVELSLPPKFTTDEPVNAAETSPTDRHHRLQRGPRLRLPCPIQGLECHWNLGMFSTSRFRLRDSSAGFRLGTCKSYPFLAA